MSKCITKIKHDKCGGNGLQVFQQDDGTIDGFCFSCGTYVRHPLGEDVKEEDIPKVKVKTEEEIQKELAEIDGYQTLSLPKRKLRDSYLKEFGVKIGVSEEDGKTPTIACYPYRVSGKLTGYKVKTLGGEKRIWTIGSMKEVDMFGWDEAVSTGARRLIITEGEEDAVALTSIIDRHTKPEWRDNKPAVVSLPFGAGSTRGKNWSRFVKQIRQSNFKEVVLCFDDDEAGKQAVLAAVKMLPEAKSVTLPAKDANECIIQGKQQAAFKAITFNSSKPKNSRLVRASSIYEKSAEPPKFGELTFPWPSVNEVTRGIRYGETHYMGAGVKMGKSELVDALEAHFIEHHGIKILSAKPEQANTLSVKKIAGKIAGKVFHDPKVEYSKEEYMKYEKIVGENLYLINMYQHLGWETLKQDIQEAVAEGCKAVFIDPITNLTNGMNAAEANVKLQEIAQDLSAMALDLNIVVFIFCHLKSPEGNISKEKREAEYKKNNYVGLGNCPHELGGDVLSSQVAGSRAMMRSCNYMWGLEGNKDSNIEDKSIKNIRNLKLLEDREFGESTIIPLYWNDKTTRFTEI